MSNKKVSRKSNANNKPSNPIKETPEVTDKTKPTDLSETNTGGDKPEEGNDSPNVPNTDGDKPSENNDSPKKEGGDNPDTINDVPDESKTDPKASDDKSLTPNTTDDEIPDNETSLDGTDDEVKKEGLLGRIDEICERYEKGMNLALVANQTKQVACQKALWSLVKEVLSDKKEGIVGFKYLLKRMGSHKVYSSGAISRATISPTLVPLMPEGFKLIVVGLMPMFAKDIKTSTKAMEVEKILASLDDQQRLTFTQALNIT